MDPEPSIAWDQGRGWFGLKPIDVAAHVALDLEHVLETFRGHQQAPRELALEHRIGGDRRPMHQKANIGQREVEAVGRLPQALHQTMGRIGRRGGGFPAMKLIGSGVEHVQVRECPPDIYRNSDWSFRS